MRSPWGRVLRAIREDEEAARSLGKNVFAYKIQSLVLGGVIGALAGALLAELGGAVGLDLPVTVFAVVGMSTFFAAVVRAPVTGVILISEMTGQTSLMVPMALAAAAAVVTATAMGGRPIYETLRIRMERGTAPAA
jgi:branched-chain amino acid transport system permease protein